MYKFVLFDNQESINFLFFLSGIIMFPVIVVIVTVGISGIILLLWPMHCFYTYYCILRLVLYPFFTLIFHHIHYSYS